MNSYPLFGKQIRKIGVPNVSIINIIMFSVNHNPITRLLVHKDNLLVIRTKPVAHAY